MDQRQPKRTNEVLASGTATRRMTRMTALNEINDRFGVGDSVRHLRSLMGKVTEKEMSADTVNAACRCVGQINETIKVAIMAAQFMSKE